MAGEALPLPSETPKKGLRSPTPLRVPIRSKRLVWPDEHEIQVRSPEFLSLMLAIRAAMLAVGFPVTDDVPTSPSDSRAAYLPPGIAGISIGERGVRIDAGDQRRLSVRRTLALTIGLIMSGGGIVWVGTIPSVFPLLVLTLVIPGSLMLALGTVWWIRTDFRSQVIRVLVKSSVLTRNWSLLEAGNQCSIQVSGGRARSENGPAGRILREVLPDTQVASTLDLLLSRIQSELSVQARS